MTVVHLVYQLQGRGDGPGVLLQEVHILTDGDITCKSGVAWTADFSRSLFQVVSVFFFLNYNYGRLSKGKKTQNNKQYFVHQVCLGLFTKLLYKERKIKVCLLELYKNIQIGSVCQNVTVTNPIH